MNHGSGKSRCIRELFSAISEHWDKTFKFPFAVNLRECWALERREEIVRRAMYQLGLDELASTAVRAYNANTLILLLDGFDELGSQSWSTDESRLRQLRSLALRGVRDLITNTECGCLVAGREHYFSSNDEMMTSLGLTKSNTVIVKAKNEFNDEELEEYFGAAGLEIVLPPWLPKRPLICQTIALLSDEEVGSMFGTNTGGVAFWNHFIKVLCQRDARINSFFDAETIYSVFVALSRITRRSPTNVGPISQRDLQDAFEAVVGKLPVDDASVMLQRLPSLGRIGAESSDRQFVDIFILDGLRAKDVAFLVERDESNRQRVLDEKWAYALGSLGQSILAADMETRIESYRQVASRASHCANRTLSADIVGAATRVDASYVDLQGLQLSNGIFTELNLSQTPLCNLSLTEALFETLVLPSKTPDNVTITHSVASKLSGAASFSGLPDWLQLDLVDEFDSVKTVAQIRRAGLSPAHEILVAMLKKTFKQKGAGRKEEALLRGFGAGTSKKIAAGVLNILMREEIIDRHIGDEGWIYSPRRKETARVSDLLDQLRASSDPLWTAVEELND